MLRLDCQLRQVADRLRQGLQIAPWLAAQAGDGLQHADFADHLLRCRD